jgi:hypothetical protein
MPAVPVLTLMLLLTLPVWNGHARWLPLTLNVWRRTPARCF